MIAASLSLLVAAQGVPADAASVPQDDEIVVTAKVGLVSLVFDKGTDGKLHNCRVLISSGMERIDRNACSTLPDCIEDVDGERFCDMPKAAALSSITPPSIAPAPVAKIDITELTKADPVTTPSVGPGSRSVGDADSDQRVELPPLPEAKSGEPAITISLGNGREQR